ncbi:MAG: histidine kinase, partial [Rubrivivax sp.]
MPTLTRHLLRESARHWMANSLQRAPGPAWLQWLWTTLFSLLLAVGFTVLGFFAFGRSGSGWGSVAGWATWFGRNAVVCLSIGYIIHGLFLLARRQLGPGRVVAWRPWQRSLFFSGVPLLGVVLGWPLGVWLVGGDILRWINTGSGHRVIVGSLLVSLMISFVLHHFFATKTRQIQAERRATEAQLRLLQGQIEPHFLFNTLANVLSLMDEDMPKARRLLENFSDYLRSSLATLRYDSATVGSEFELAQAYLVLLQTRMEERLCFDIELPPALRHAKLPPLLLQPLVENAIHHGLEPKVDGGRLRLSARTDGPALVIEVADDGLGLQAA